MSVEDLRKRAEAIAAGAQDEANAFLREDRLKEAKAVLTSAQRDVRDLKREAADEQREIREAAADTRLKISGQGQTVGFFTGSKARGAMARARAAAKRDLAQRKAEALRPYDSLKSALDRLIADIDRSKAQITAEVPDRGGKATEESAAPAASAPEPTVPPPPTPAQWAKDPYDRHEFRWWDGTTWTEHVSDGGVASVDNTGA